MATITKTLTNAQIYDSAIKLIENFKEDVTLPVRVSFYLQKNIETITAAAQEIEAARAKIVERFNAQDIDEETANTEIQDLFNLEQDVKLNILKLEWFDEINLSSQQVSAILFMIEEE